MALVGGLVRSAGPPSGGADASGLPGRGCVGSYGLLYFGEHAVSQLRFFFRWSSSAMCDLVPIADI
jgi:hypothetical protein